MIVPVLVLAVALLVGGCSEAGRPPAAKGAAAEGGPALAALDDLAVKGRAPRTGYDREQFGGDWASTDGCETRERILARDLRRIIYEPGSTCEISSGILHDRYTAQRLIFHRGGASEVDIDHVVPLSDAWQKGAQRWSYRRRVRFANDPPERDAMARVLGKCPRTRLPAS
jgi:hypothetical protein